MKLFVFGYPARGGFMKAFVLFAGLLIGVQAFADCDVTKAARQAVKAIVAVEDIKGITAYYGGTSGSDSDYTNVNISPTYQGTKDWYVVKVRNRDCRTFSVELRAENIPVTNN